MNSARHLLTRHRWRDALPSLRSSNDKILMSHHLPQVPPSSTGHTIFHRSHHLPQVTPSSTGHTIFHKSHHLPQVTPSSTGHTIFLVS
ncbi:hypothetical protein RRG08_036784 [Elysia crispata]|uniref:Uncharacterized protein n=1 Tax=Elysia crispata TaxID=231223 RepID=A0AAE1DXK1_9GAST|nr:hypothetical protein RRG08_036784 [Elysia crispata]